MSVVSSARGLPGFLIPQRLHMVHRNATGDDSLQVWRLGTGPFLESLVTPQLRLVPGTKKHGVVEPAVSMKLEEYRAALAATREDWTVDES